MNWKSLVIVLVGIGAFFASGLLLRQNEPSIAEVYEEVFLFDEVMRNVADYYVDSLEPGELYDLALDGMLQKLGDPYTSYFREQEFEELASATTGNYGGIGVRVEARNGWLTVVTPLAGTPADSAGILPGDRIVELDGHSTAGWSVDQAVTAMRGIDGSTIRMAIQRSGVAQALQFALERTSIHLNAVRFADFASDGVAYVWLETVSESSAVELESAIDSLRGAGARALIVDLRANPGGLLDQAIAIADLFLEENAAVVETRGREAAANRMYRAETPPRWTDQPIVILVDPYTASAAEIIAGALQDNDAALVLGSPTFGKGLVQTVFRFGAAEALKITTGRWFTPIGRSIQRTDEADSIAEVATEFRSVGGRMLQGGNGGIIPDVAVRDRPEASADQELQRALGASVQHFNDELSAYGAELVETGTVLSHEFTNSVSQRAELRQRLVRRGVVVPDTTWSRAASVIDQRLSRLAVRYGLGRMAELRRRIRDDLLVQQALELLNGVTTSQELIARGSNQ